MPLTGFDHYTIRAQDVDVTAAFYADVLGLRVERLDSFDFPFALLFHGDDALVHLLGMGPSLDEFLGRSAPAYQDGPERGTGNLEHPAFNATGFADFKDRLDRAGVPYADRTLADHGVRQLLFEDPDGIELEVNFPLDE